MMSGSPSLVFSNHDQSSSWQHEQSDRVSSKLISSTVPSHTRRYGSDLCSGFPNNGFSSSEANSSNDEGIYSSSPCSPTSREYQSSSPSDYVAVPVTASIPALDLNENGEKVLDDDRYRRNEKAALSILGRPLHILVKCSGFDDTYSLFKKETRRNWIAFMATPIGLASAIFLFVRFFRFLEMTDVKAFTYAWGEMLAMGFLALHAFGASLALFKWTRGLIFLEFYEAHARTLKQPPTASLTAPGSSFVFVVLFLFAIAISIAGSAKHALYGYEATANNSSSASTVDLLLAGVMTGEPLISAWAIAVSVLAATVYVRLHNIVIPQLTAFVSDVKEASEAGTLAEQLPSLSERHASLLSLSSLLGKRCSLFASPAAIGAVASNAFVMYISMAHKTELDAFSLIMTIAWTFLTIGLMATIFILPSKLQKLINDANAALLQDKIMWNGDEKIRSLALGIVSRSREANTHVTIMQCFRLTQRSPHFAMVLPPLVGLPLIALKVLSTGGS